MDPTLLQILRRLFEAERAIDQLRAERDGWKAEAERLARAKEEPPDAVAAAVD